MMLKDKVAVVTGGSRGIGLAIAKKLAAEGADIAILDICPEEAAADAVAALTACGVRAKAYSCSVADYDAVAAVFKAIVKEDFGRVDILVNNAGITRDKMVLAMKPEDFDLVIDVNLKGAFNTIKQVYPIFAKQKSGKIINISSVAGLMGNSGQANYAASKAGLVGMTKTVAKELASRGVCCNAVAPGFVETGLTKEFCENEQIVGAIPAKRVGRPEEVADLVFFLASPMSDYITGEVIRIDGGMAM